MIRTDCIIILDRNSSDRSLCVLGQTKQAKWSILVSDERNTGKRAVGRIISGRPRMYWNRLRDEKRKKCNKGKKGDEGDGGGGGGGEVENEEISYKLTSSFGRFWSFFPFGLCDLAV